MSSEFICLRLRFAKDCAKLTKHSAVFAPNFNQNASKKLSKPGEAWRCSTNYWISRKHWNRGRAARKCNNNNNNNNNKR